MKQRTFRLTCAALCLALALVLPFLTGQIPAIGRMLCPMHIPVFLCGFLCGWPWGLLVGFLAPLLRSVLFGMPAMLPNGVAMAFELATYGAVCGVLYRVTPKKAPYLYLSLLSAMIAGRAVWGAARYLIAGLTHSSFPFSAFLAGAVTEAIPGIVLHILLVPPLVLALRRAGLTDEGKLRRAQGSDGSETQSTTENDRRQNHAND